MPASNPAAKAHSTAVHTKKKIGAPALVGTKPLNAGINKTDLMPKNPPQVRRTGRTRNTPERMGMASQQDYADAGLEDFWKDDPVTGRPGAPKALWDKVYMVNTPPRNWTDIQPSGSGSSPDVAHEVQCQEPTCRAKSRTIQLNAKFQELNASGTPHGQLRRPPLCHILPWVALRAYLDEVEQKNFGMVHNTDFVKAYCWYAPNIQPGHNVCNGSGTHDTAATVTAKQKKDAEAQYNTVVNSFTGSVLVPK